jgi:hypothetical protein
MRKCTPRQLCNYYKEFYDYATERDYAQQILTAIERGSVAPSPTWDVWLSVTETSTSVALGLDQNFSIIVKRASIKALGISFFSWRYEWTWQDFGGAAGMIDVFAKMSINEVRDACKFIGRSAKGEDVANKRHHVTQLFECLHPDVFPGLEFYTYDERPLAKYYRHLIPGCDEVLVERIVSGDLKGTWRPTSDKLLMRFHPDVVRREQLRALERDSDVAINSNRFLRLATYSSSGSSTTPNFSPSMDFAMDVLKRLVKDPKYQLADDIAIQLIRSLLRRAINKKLDWSTVRDMVDLSMQYFGKYPTARRRITANAGDILQLISICWALQPEIFEEQLKILCSGTDFGVSINHHLIHWADLLNRIPKRRRYALLRLCMVESYELDLESDTALKSFMGSLEDSLLDKLEPEDALNLFNRLRAARGDDNLVIIRAPNTIQGITAVYNTSTVDFDLYHVALLNRNGLHAGARSIATTQLELRKQKAENASAPEQRAFYASCTLYYGIASGDLQIYHDVLQWTKRFLRDPQVLPGLYTRHSYPREVITLLSGIPQTRSDLTIDEVRDRVCFANVILQSMLDTACSAIREPSFQVSHWEGTLDLFPQVTQERINRSKALRKDLSASDAEMYDALWADTLEMLLTVEKKANHSQNQRLEAHIICGPLAWRCWGSSRRHDLEHAKNEKHVYSFFDNFAKARDEYWQDLRSSVHPAVLTLPEPLPRGLPIQFLTAPWVFDVPDLEQLAPYIANRAKAVVFQDAATALLPVADDEEHLEAIGMLVDSYQYALRLYIPESLDKEERTKRIEAAWNHAIGPMSHGRMNKDEAVRWWKTKAPDHLRKHWPPHAKIDTGISKWPLIPDVDDPVQPTEWNPFSSKPLGQPKRDLGKLTYLDLTVVVLGRVPATSQIWTKSKLFDYIPTVPGDEVDSNQIWNPSRDMGEGGVLSALLYLEMKYGAPTGRLLQKPFPSADDARYPSLYLDDGFKGDSLSSFSAVRQICDQCDSIPPVLMHLSAQNMMEKLWALDREEHDDHSVQELALTLLVRLIESDRPALAQDMALHVLLNRPEASSWHRQLLKLSYLRRMSSSDAKAFIERFADSILERMLAARNEHDAMKLRNALFMDAPTSSAPQPKKDPHVKVTTIKSLAQLLRDAECVPETFTLTVLHKLLVWSTHRDVRLHTAKTLCSMYITSSLETSDTILAILETLTPLAGNLNETNPVTENDWQIAEETLELPTYPGIDDELVLSNLFVSQALNRALKVDKLSEFIARILLPTLSGRQSQISRWLALFGRKYSGSDAKIYMPVIPLHATTLLASHAATHLPKYLLTDLIAWIEFKNAPPPGILALHAHLRDDPTLLKREDVQTFISLFPFTPCSATTFGSYEYLSLLDKPTRHSGDKGISDLDVKDAFVMVFKLALSVDARENEMGYERLGKGLLCKLLTGGYMGKEWWHSIGKDIVREMIRYVGGLRSEEWKRDGKRTPVVLPDVFPWRLLLLDFPLGKDADGDGEEEEEKCEQFAMQISALCEEISGGVYHKKLSQIKEYVGLSIPGSHQEKTLRNRLRTALHLGAPTTSTSISTSPNDTITIAGHLEIEIAAHLLSLVPKNQWEDLQEKDLRDKVRGVVQMWRNHSDEDIRRIAVEFEWVHVRQEGNAHRTFTTDTDSSETESSDEEGTSDGSMSF